MADEKRRVTLQEWHAEGREQFSDDPKDWKFTCPSCGHVQSLADFLALGMKNLMAQDFLAFRIAPNEVMFDENHEPRLTFGWAPTEEKDGR